MADYNAITDITPLAALTHLTSLNLSGTAALYLTNLNGLQNLTKLKTLQLGNSSIWRLQPLAFTDISPLAALTDLETLDLHNRSVYLLDTPSRIQDLSPLSNLTKLTTLDLIGLELDDTSLNQIVSYPALHNITTLRLGGYRSGRIPTNLNFLNRLPNLKDLTFNNWGITDFSILNSLSTLTDLSIINWGTVRANNFNSLDFISNLTNLNSLLISNDRDADQPANLDINGNLSDISALSSMHNLRNLTITGQKVSDITALTNLTSLTEINFGTGIMSTVGNLVSDLTPLAGLTNLTTLQLDNNNISDLSPLAGLTNLQALYVGNTQPGHTPSLPDYNPGLAHNHVSDVTPLAGLIQLGQLWLPDNQITDITPLSGLNNIYNLFLQNNQIRDLTPIGNTPAAQFWVYGNPLDNAQMGIVSQMPNLHFLGVGDDSLTDITPLTSMNLTQLTLQGSNLDISRLSSNISQFRTLRDLALQKNKFSDQQFSQIISQANLNYITTLSVTGSHITDITPITDNAAKFSNMSYLTMSDNEIADITPLTIHMSDLPGTITIDISKQRIRLPDKPDFDLNTPMSLGPATIDSASTPKRYAPADSNDLSTPLGGGYSPATGTMTWPATLPGTHNFNFYYAEALSLGGNLTFSGTITQGVPGITVSFDPDGGSPQPAVQYHHVGEKVDLPISPSKNGVLLGGWTNSETGSMWNFGSDTVSKDITLKAYWTTPMTLPTAGAIPLTRLSGLTILLTSGGALALYILMPKRSRGKHLSRRR
ncbi:hypothetical protein KIMH_13810 [Bombiscardovia apis]|uniref:Uncharacterized protein n=2 Tax=Bombiscardovia apis TaxID=2932182 RepID=A0ABM8BEB9_9BIFI|nr:hypothetical protein KIMH_13810 [Bombiscardovia apis]